jgi:hypothetical protein
MGRRKIEIEDDDDDLDDGGQPSGYVETPAAWESHPVAKQVQSVLDGLEAPPIDRATRSTLQRYLWRRQKHGDLFRDEWGSDGRGYITVLIRTILESEGNGPDALIDPIVSAVSSCMEPRWTEMGLKWIEAYDSIPLRALLQALRDLDAFEERDLSSHLSVAIRNRLRKILGPSVLPKPEPVKVKPRPKMVRPAGISEQSWNEVIALRKSQRSKTANFMEADNDRSRYKSTLGRRIELDYVDMSAQE